MISYFRHTVLFPVIASLALSLCVSASADDAQAGVEMDKGLKAFAAGDFRGAAKAYEAAELYADSPGLKLKAIQKAADSYGKADLKYKEFLCLKKQISGFADKIDFAKTVEREYAIGNEFMKGHRDVTLAWLPWIKEPNRAVKIYETILKQVPFAKFAPTLKLRLGRIYIENDEYEKSLSILRDLIRKHPKSKAAKYGRFELANALVQLAGKAGDGDGAYAREAEDLLKESLRLYPNDPETQWLRESKSDTDAVRAERLFYLADFYESRENKEAAIRYFRDLVARFPDDKLAAEAEKRLVKLDNTYKPRREEKKTTSNPYPVSKIPEERGVMLATPESSGGRWLLPVEDLDLDGKHAEREYQSRKKALEALRKRRQERLARLKAKRDAERKRLEAKRKKEAAAKAAVDAERKKEMERKADQRRRLAQAKLKEIQEKTERNLKKQAAERALEKEKAKKKMVGNGASVEKSREATSGDDRTPAKGEKREKRNTEDKNKPEKTVGESKTASKSTVSKNNSKVPESASASTRWIDILFAILALVFVVAAIVMLKKKKEQS